MTEPPTSSDLTHVVQEALRRLTTDVPSYTYDATVVRWVDGDTVDLRVDLGFYIHIESRFRLYGINTPERGQTNYAEATAEANRLAPVSTAITVQTYRPVADKYGRFLARINATQPDGSVVCVNDQLIADGLAVPYFGGTKATGGAP